jgi:GNAT superfamily N-acetyltransferase
VEVRDAGPDDVPDLMGLWAELRAEANGGRSAIAGPVSPKVRLEEALADPAIRLLLATLAGQPAGMAVLTEAAATPLAETRAVHLNYVVVHRRARRRGVGRALVAAAAAYAEEVGASHVMVSVYPALREANRFYARLGFAPFVVRRAAPAAALRRKLSPDPRPARINGTTLSQRRPSRRPLLRREVGR